MASRRSKRHMRNTRNRSQLHGKLSKAGVEVWRHFFWATSLEKGEMEPFLLEFLLLNPTLKEDKHQPFFHAKGSSFAMVRLIRLSVKDCQPASFFSMREVELSKHILSLRFGRNVCLEDALAGQILTLDKDVGVRFGLAKAGSASWELQLHKSQSYGYGFDASRFITAYGLVGMSWHVGGLKAAVDGYLVVDDDEFRVQSATSYGFQDKIWGGHLGNDWIKLYGGELCNPTSGEACKDDVLTIFRHKHIVFGKEERFTYHFIYVHNGVMYDFSSDQKRTLYTFEEGRDGEKIEAVLEAVTAHKRLVVKLHTDAHTLRKIEYPHPAGGNLVMSAVAPVTGEVELYSLVPLSGWELEVQQRLVYALYESSSLT